MKEHFLFFIYLSNTFYLSFLTFLQRGDSCRVDLKLSGNKLPQDAEIVIFFARKYKKMMVKKIDAS